MVEGLLPKRLEILRFIARRTGEGRAPTIPEIGRAVGLRSSQTVYHHLKRLERDGYLQREEGRPRTARLTERGWEAVVTAPLMGRIAAGRGLEAVADEEAYALAGELLSPRGGRRRYLLRVVGQSMIGAHIADGDLCVVEEDEDPPDGTVVVALMGGGEEVTVKRLYREDGSVRLRAENDGHEDIVCPAGEVKVQGRVVYVIHPPRS